MNYNFLILASLWLINMTLALLALNYTAAFNAAACSFFCFLLFIHENDRLKGEKC